MKHDGYPPAVVLIALEVHAEQEGREPADEELIGYVDWGGGYCGEGVFLGVGVSMGEGEVGVKEGNGGGNENGKRESKIELDRERAKCEG